MFHFVNGAVLRSVRVVSALMVLVSVAVVFPDRNFSLGSVIAATTGSSPCEQTVSSDAGVTVTYTGGKCVVQFTSTSAAIDWTSPTGITSVELLVVGGGGGGGSRHAGGGGGGGVSNETITITAATQYTVTVGAGGAGGTAGGDGSTGGQSNFKQGATTIGYADGGEGGTRSLTPSGGRNGLSTSSPTSRNLGGVGSNACTFGWCGGGGAGAGGVGQDGDASDNNAAGGGGAGISSSISGSSRAYGGGGGGSSGGVTQLRVPGRQVVAVPMVVAVAERRLRTAAQGRDSLEPLQDRTERPTLAVAVVAVASGMAMLMCHSMSRTAEFQRPAALVDRESSSSATHPRSPTHQQAWWQLPETPRCPCHGLRLRAAALPPSPTMSLNTNRVVVPGRRSPTVLLLPRRQLSPASPTGPPTTSVSLRRALLALALRQVRPRRHHQLRAPGRRRDWQEPALPRKSHLPGLLR